VPYEVVENGWRVSDDRARLDLDAVHSCLRRSYWTPDITREQVERQTAHSSFVFGVYTTDTSLLAQDEDRRQAAAATEQVGFARVLTDATRFAYVCDVIVREDCRGQGLGKLLMRAIMDHPELRMVRRWMLATKDAHGLYEQFGFGALPKPEMWMQLKRSEEDGPVWR
jgi:ribosomal protein S18 acetylase RimI-like enzyme